jgi:hypothetical protein
MGHHKATPERFCEVCGDLLRSDNTSGICVRTAECNRVRAQKARRARGIRPLGDTLRERLFSGLVIVPSGCLMWTGGLDQAGYGKIRTGSRMRAPHIVLWELHEGTVPEGFELDHLCHSRDRVCPGGKVCPHRRCANLLHLEPVTRLTNTRRAYDRPATRVALGRLHSSQYTGVTWHRQARKWQAVISIAGNNRYLGLFASEEDAALAYMTAAQSIPMLLEAGS